MEPIILTSDLTKGYPSGRSGELQVLKGIDLIVRRGELLAITGPSGVGKSTLLHILGTLDKPTGGLVEFDGKAIFNIRNGKPVESYSDKQLTRFRNSEIGFIFQSHYLLEEFNALENIQMPALINGKSLSATREDARRILKQVGLEDRWKHKPGELSGGEQQRIAVGRALMNEPTVLLADEPSGNLDTGTAEELHKLLWQLTRKHGRTIIVVTHNTALADMADRVIRLHDGKIIEELTNDHS